MGASLKKIVKNTTMRVIFLLIQHVPGQLVHVLVRQVKVPVGASTAGFGHQLLFHPGGGGRGEMNPKAETIFLNLSFSISSLKPTLTDSVMFSVNVELLLTIFSWKV